ncbi:MAG: hypothetical protein A7315_06000 [Candidatus Altiarchaeales archaeon WOR_SM1_79]|nr:MAG: hypothetical protein A7315_06000 [Candidatus Altiarchaeales archaeon WOR_SM1_79]
MKICFISPKAYQLFNPEVKSTFGGAQVQLYYLANEFSGYKDVKIRFMVADYGQDDVEIHKKIKVYKSLNLKDNFIKQIIDFYRVFNKIDADIYIQRAPSPFSGIIAFYCKILNRKFAYMIGHDLETDGTYEKNNNLLKSFFANLVFKYSDLIITQNEYQKMNLKQRNIESTVIKSGYPVQEYIETKKNYILWVGRSESWKRPELFLKLAEQNPDFKFVMICPPSTYNPQLSGRIKKEAQKLNNLKFIDFVPFNQIDKYFGEAKIFVNTSTQEGFPNTFVQAAKNKTPIVSLSVNPDNFLERYECGFFCNNDIELINKNMNILLSNKNLYKRMSENAYNYAKKNHDIKKNAEKFYELIGCLK